MSIVRRNKELSLRDNPKGDYLWSALRTEAPAFGSAPAVSSPSRLAIDGWIQPENSTAFGNGQVYTVDGLSGSDADALHDPHSLNHCDAQRPDPVSLKVHHVTGHGGGCST